MLVLPLILSSGWLSAAALLVLVKCSSNCLKGGKSCVDLSFECEYLQVKVGCVLELPDQKAREFLVLIAFKLLFPEHARKVFDKMSVMT
jgi:hypothetical protein